MNRLVPGQLALALMVLFGDVARAGKAAEATGPDRNLSTNEITPRAAAPESITQAHRLAWNLQTTVVDYRVSGQTNALWNAEVEQGLEAFARIRSEGPTTNQFAVLQRSLTAAWDKGCRDPLVGYLLLRVRFPDEGPSSAEALAAYRSATTSLATSQYSPLRKFYAALRTSTQARNIPTSGTNLAEITELRTVSDKYRRHAFDFLRAAFEDPRFPLPEATEAVQQLRYDNPHPTLRKQVYPPLASFLRERWPDQVAALVVVGALEIDLAWADRGSGTSEKVTKAGWAGFEEHLTQAAAALEHAWSLGPTNLDIPLQMMTVALGDPRHAEHHVTWFRRAMELDPNSYDACRARLEFLLPRWHGSDEEVVAFGRECLAAEAWGGRVPLILVDAHNLVAGPADPRRPYTYWRKPGVWEDVHASFEKFFRLNPTQTGWYHNYALHAYRCGQYAKFTELLPLLGRVNYEYFGGPERFETLVRSAKEQVEKEKTRRESLPPGSSKTEI